MSEDRASNGGMRFVSKTNPQMSSGMPRRLYYKAFAETKLACSHLNRKENYGKRICRFGRHYLGRPKTPLDNGNARLIKPGIRELGSYARIRGRLGCRAPTSLFGK